MCAIAGVVGLPPVEAMTAVQLMLRAQTRRGPDGQGIEQWTNTVLGHRRLAVFDLSEAGSQPMLADNGSVGVVFNGAIYNFRELREELEGTGFIFESQTDTEVLTTGYLEWGIRGLVTRLEGMFAFALWDERCGKLFLVRDRLGVKPLVFCADGPRIAFASTVRALKEAGIAGFISAQAVAEYLALGFVTDQRSIYSDVTKLPPGTLLEWSAGTIVVDEYWHPPSISRDRNVTFEDAVSATEDMFLKAVKKRLAADVPVAALLSGGIDSALVCWAISRLGAPVSAYTVGIASDPADESADAMRTASELGMELNVLDISASGATDVQMLARAYSEPFACASALGMLKVSEAIASTARVVLTGDGGDDVFLGYPEHRHFALADMIGRVIPPSVARTWSTYRGKRGPELSPIARRAASLIDYSTMGLEAVLLRRDCLRYCHSQDILGPRLTAVPAPLNPYGSAQEVRGLLRQFLEYDRVVRFSGEYLPKIDGGTMYFALESRSPFLDHKLWEFASSLPFFLRLHNGRLKAILREVAHRRISKRVATAPKRGFDVPVERWLRRDWRLQVEECLRNSILAAEGWINADSAMRSYSLALKYGGRLDHIWRIFVFEHWLRHELSATAPG
jgi:asparagine synthase (glutamine-hydrolysing)